MDQPKTFREYFEANRENVLGKRFAPENASFILKPLRFETRAGVEYLTVLEISDDNPSPYLLSARNNIWPVSEIPCGVFDFQELVKQTA